MTKEINRCSICELCAMVNYDIGVVNISKNCEG